MIRIASALALITGPAFALELSLPIDCEMGERCYIQSLVDRDAGPGAADYTCGSLSYDGHKGVDFRVSTFAEMKQGVDVIAAAPGRVRAIRDGVADMGLEAFPEGQDCGNAVVITHPGGWETQYCHLARGSVAVRAGNQVKAGDQLGRIGFSGRTEFPHLHFSVRKDGAPMDPFGAQEMTDSCALEETDSLWSDEVRGSLAYRPGGIVDIGLTDTAPNLSDIRAGIERNLVSDGATTLIMWTRFFGVRTGDELTMRLMGPDGEVFRNSTVMTRNRAEEMRYAGKRSANGWPAGRYDARATITRGGQAYETMRETFELN